jgi:hypothetical protein
MSPTIEFWRPALIITALPSGRLSVAVKASAPVRPLPPVEVARPKAA